MLGLALATFVKGMKIWLRKNWLFILAEREVPQHRNCWWSHEFMINYDGYWYAGAAPRGGGGGGQGANPPMIFFFACQLSGQSCPWWQYPYSIMYYYSNFWSRGKCVEVPPPPPLFQDLRDFRGWQRQLQGILPPPPSKHPGAAPVGMCCVWRVPLLAPAPPNYIQPHPIPQHVLSRHHEHPATPLPLPYHITPCR